MKKLCSQTRSGEVSYPDFYGGSYIDYDGNLVILIKEGYEGDASDLLGTNVDNVVIKNCKSLNPQLHSRSATYIKRNGFLIRKTAIKSSRPFHCAYHPLTP